MADNTKLIEAIETATKALDAALAELKAKPEDKAALLEARLNELSARVEASDTLLQKLMRQVENEVKRLNQMVIWKNLVEGRDNKFRGNPVQLETAITRTAPLVNPAVSALGNAHERSLYEMLRASEIARGNPHLANNPSLANAIGSANRDHCQSPRNANADAQTCNADAARIAGQLETAAHITKNFK